MKKRNLLVVLLLSYLVFPVYALYWTYQVRRDLVARLGDQKAVPGFVWLLVPIIGALPIYILVLITALLSWSRSSGGSGSAESMFVLLPFIFLGVLTTLGIFLYWFYRFTQALYKVTSGIEPVLNLILFAISLCTGMVPIWIIFMQQEIHNVLEKEQLEADSRSARTPDASQPPSTPVTQPPTHTPGATIAPSNSSTPPVAPANSTKPPQ